mmetsp:Transcript_8969/g.19828  ORF Transcript_8969/g.19828 Transcript_8969/m.19828 type:complete len:252 (+) Transcript_8969:505-1260(+)
MRPFWTLAMGILAMGTPPVGTESSGTIMGIIIITWCCKPEPPLQEHPAVLLSISLLLRSVHCSLSETRSSCASCNTAHVRCNKSARFDGPASIALDGIVTPGVSVPPSIFLSPGRGAMRRSSADSSSNCELTSSRRRFSRSRLRSTRRAARSSLAVFFFLSRARAGSEVHPAASGAGTGPAGTAPAGLVAVAGSGVAAGADTGTLTDGKAPGWVAARFRGMGTPRDCKVCNEGIEAAWNSGCCDGCGCITG